MLRVPFLGIIGHQTGEKLGNVANLHLCLASTYSGLCWRFNLMSFNDSITIFSAAFMTQNVELCFEMENCGLRTAIVMMQFEWLLYWLLIEPCEVKNARRATAASAESCNNRPRISLQ